MRDKYLFPVSNFSKISQATKSWERCMRSYPMAERKNWRYYGKEYENWLWQRMAINTLNHTHTYTALLKL